MTGFFLETCLLVFKCKSIPCHNRFKERFQKVVYVDVENPMRNVTGTMSACHLDDKDWSRVSGCS